MSRMTLPPEEKMARKAGIASFVGTSVEWFDFYIYGTAAALVFGPVFFSSLSPSVATLLSFATFWAGFLARPIGSIIFGHVGDRIGRKKALITTLLLMGFSTLGIGLLPTYPQIGALAPVLLTLLRVVQGLAVGGEWGGAVLIATEHASKKRGVIFGAFAQQGSPAGQIMASLSFMLVSQLPDESFHSWGWRLPFLLSAVMVVVGLVIRLSIEESPAMKQLQQAHQTVRYPLLEVVKQHRAAVGLAIAATAVVYTAAYFKNTFALSWATTDLGFSRQDFLTIILVASTVQFFVQPFGAILASRFPMGRIVTILLLLELPAIVLMFWMIGTGSYSYAMLGMVIATLPHVMYYALMAGLLAQAFPPEVRYTAISLSYSLGGALIGGTTPMIGQALLNAFGSIVPVVVYALFTCLVSLFGAVALLGKTRKAKGEGKGVSELVATQPREFRPSGAHRER